MQKGRVYLIVLEMEGTSMEKKEVNIYTNCPAETEELALKLASFLRGGEVLALRGDLGAGKTRFTQGLAKGLGIKRKVNSPTFTLIKEYQGTKLPLYHMDVYRLEDEWEELGFEEYFYGQGVTVIEWPEKIFGQLPSERLEITISKLGETRRKISFLPIGKRYEQLVNEVLA